jgi:predicted MFS family arabinose efflux permease
MRGEAIARTHVHSTPRLQQHATRAAFFLPGFAMAAWAPIVPFAKARAGLDEASLGLVLLCLGAGSLLAMPLAGALCARQGCRRVMLAASVLMCAMLPLLALAPNAVALAGVLFAFGAAVGTMDCAMNIQAVVVERESGRTLMSGFHAFYSVGGFAGAAALTVLLSLGLAPWLACAAGAVLLLVMLGLALGHWRGERAAPGGAVFAWPHGIVLLVGAACFVVFLAEGAMLDWGAVFLAGERQVDPARAGTGYVVFSLAMTACRLVGDRLVDAVGRMCAVSGGGLLAFAGFLVLAWAPWPAGSLLGFALVGVGCANIVPVMFSLAGGQRAMPAALAIPAISTLGYAGILAGPALIGFIAQGTSLVAALLWVAAAVLAVAVTPYWLRRI